MFGSPLSCMARIAVSGLTKHEMTLKLFSISEGKHPLDNSLWAPREIYNRKVSFLHISRILFARRLVFTVQLTILAYAGPGRPGYDYNISPVFVLKEKVFFSGVMMKGAF
uniref:Uncharacterized protein n=1 Tax=Micrurus lemniscatus lemniscatus TaxID=129467 RepID=A0A2D4JHK7_MICLE